VGASRELRLASNSDREALPPRYTSRHNDPSADKEPPQLLETQHERFWDTSVGRQRGCAPTPFNDIFHIQAIQVAVFERRGSILDRRYLEDLLHILWPQGTDHMPWFYLARLVDTRSLYSKARVIAPGVGEQRVWRWFMEQIKSFLEEGSPL
jgi:hypothetical protein